MPRSFFCEKCSELITAHMRLGESVKCEKCGFHNSVPEGATVTDKADSIIDPLNVNKGVRNTPMLRFRCAKCRKWISSQRVIGDYVSCDSCGFSNVIPESAYAESLADSCDHTTKSTIDNPDLPSSQVTESTTASDLRTLKDEVEDKSKAVALNIGGVIALVLGIFLSVKVSPVFILLAFSCFIFFGIASSKWAKASHVALVREAVRREAIRQSNQNDGSAGWLNGTFTTSLDIMQDKSRAIGYVTSGVVIFALAVLLSIKVHWSMISLITVSMLLFALGSKVLYQARFVAWTREGIRRECRLILLNDTDTSPLGSEESSELDTMTCKNCGAVQLAGSEFCNHCGISHSWSEDLTPDAE